MEARKFLRPLVLASILLLAGAISATASTVPASCSESDAGVFTLWGGQTIDVGTVTVAKDENNLYVTYQTSGDWYLKDAKLHVETTPPAERLNLGHADFKSGDIIPCATSYAFTVPLLEDQKGCNGTTTGWLQAYAKVVKIVGAMEIAEEGAYGGTITIASSGGSKKPNDSWYGNINYSVECCDEQCFNFHSETAWAAGNRYTAQGNWATYTPYVAGSTVILYAGQTMVAGTVSFSDSDNGNVTITINLTGDWVFADVSENVKIQDYEVAPSGNPSAGLFAYKYTASGKSFNTTVPKNGFYGVHADVGYWVEVECPLE